jgi:oligosaccharyltransferase complex subunit gamma
MLLLAPLLALLLTPLSFAASVEKDHAQLVRLAEANNGVIPLDEASFTALTNSKRTWSAAIQFTAMDNRRRCAPCKCVKSIRFSTRYSSQSKGNSSQPGLL